MVSTRIVRLLLAAVLASPLAAAAAPLYTVAHLPFTSIEKVKLNNAGQVSGSFFSDEGELRAGIWRNGTLTVLPVSSADWPAGIVATGINASGAVIGWGGTMEGEQAWVYAHGRLQAFGSPGMRPYAINAAGRIAGPGFLYSHGTVMPLDGMGYVWGMNNAGTIVGTVGGDLRAAMMKHGEVSLLDPADPNQSVAYDVNDAGQVVGFHMVQQPDGSLSSEPFLYSRGVMRNLGLLPGATQGSAYAINNAGQVVGWTTGADGQGAAFLYSQGQLHKLSDLVLGGYAIMGETHDINDAGQIVAWACRDDPYYCGFVLLTPVSKSAGSSPDQASVNPADRL